MNVVQCRTVSVFLLLRVVSPIYAFSFSWLMADYLRSPAKWLPCVCVCINEFQTKTTATIELTPNFSTASTDLKSVPQVGYLVNKRFTFNGPHFSRFVHQWNVLCAFTQTDRITLLEFGAASSGRSFFHFHILLFA